MTNSPEQKLIEALNLIMRCDSLECAKSHSALANTFARHFLDELAELREKAEALEWLINEELDAIRTLLVCSTSENKVPPILRHMIEQKDRP